MKTSDLLAALLKSGMTPSAGDRIKNSLGGGDALDKLAGLGLHPEVARHIKKVVGLKSA